MAIGIAVKHSKHEKSKRISFLLLVMTFVISCTSMKNDSNAPVSGKVESIEGGKDGYTAKLQQTQKKCTLPQLVL